MYLYDSMMIYLNATNQMVNRGISPRNGTAFAETAKKITAQGNNLIYMQNNTNRID